MQGAERAGEYVSKFQNRNELTDSMNKEGRAKNRNQWQILHDANLGDAQSKALFFEYAKAALSSKRQLAWSKGLKDKFGIADLSDEELNELEEVAESEITSQKYIDLDWDHWLVVVRHRLQPPLSNCVKSLGLIIPPNISMIILVRGVTLVVDSYEKLRQFDVKGVELKQRV